MPSVSPAQKRTMAAIAHGWHPPASSGIKIPVKVAKEFNAADTGLTSPGGIVQRGSYMKAKRG